MAELFHRIHSNEVFPLDDTVLLFELGPACVGNDMAVLLKQHSPKTSGACIRLHEELFFLCVQSGVHQNRCPGQLVPKVGKSICTFQGSGEWHTLLCEVVQW